jgi:hypothetical protein
MYYTHKCSYCSRVFYTYNDNKEAAAHTLFVGIKKHLVDYGEDHKEYEFDDEHQTEVDEMYYAATESPHAPAGGYELR